MPSIQLGPKQLPNHLPLEDQLVYTSGQCAAFAQAAQPILGGQLTFLFCADDRHFEIHDWPRDVPFCMHVFLTMPDGSCVDAEGRRPLVDLLRSFGVKEGWDFRVEYATQVELDREFPPHQEDTAHIARARGLICENDWFDSVPEADGRLSECYATISAGRP